MSAVAKEEMTARREAAAKIARNRQLVIDRLCSHSGVVRRQGSEFGETVENVNGATSAYRAVITLQAPCPQHTCVCSGSCAVTLHATGAQHMKRSLHD